MLALIILLFGLLVVLLIAGVVFIYLGLAPVFAWAIPVVPGLVAVGAIMLALIELLMVFGSSDDRRILRRDMKWFFSVILVSGLLAWVSARVLWH